jgi:hypothetical protein
MKIQLSKYKWNSVEYITATRHPYCDDIVDRTTWDSIAQWCEQHYGPRGDPWARRTASRWYFNGGTVFFKQQSDLTLFLLRWACE